MKSRGGMRRDHRLGGFLLFVVAIALSLSLGSTCAFADVIIDNGDPGTSYTGTWSVSGGTQPYGSDSLWARNGAKYTWQLDSQPSGTYEVLMWWSGWSSRATSIPVAINHADGTAALSINQKQNAGMWNSLGTFYFDTAGSVTITAASGSTVSTCADAVWFRLVSANARPSAFIDTMAPNPAQPGETITFAGHGTDDGSVVAYHWESSIDGELSDQSSFTTSLLSAGTHVISFLVQDSQNLWSEPMTRELRVGTTSGEAIIDNGDPQTSRTGTWQVSGGTAPYGPDSLWARNGATFTWIFNPSQPGNYDISMWWSGWASRATNVSVAIDHANGRATLSINQSQNAGKWNSLGSYYFTSSGRVTITAASGSTVSTCADAVKFTVAANPGLPVADFAADKTSGGAPLTVQFTDQSVGTISNWLWDFGDGGKSSSRNPSHQYTTAGTYTVSLTVANSAGANTKTRTNYILINPPGENIYLCHAYIENAAFMSGTINMLQGLGATEQSGVWVYKNKSKNTTYYMRFITTPEGMKQALREDGAHVIFNGHANFGSGAVFATPAEFKAQVINDIRFVDDDRFVNLSTEMLSLKIAGMKFGQAYPNWEPILKNGTSALMPYDFAEGLPPYNYLLSYKIPGDPASYRIELRDGSFLERFPDSNTPPWFSSDGSPPDPVQNPEYFITNPTSDFNRCDFVGAWPHSEQGSGFQEYNYQYHSAGTGANKATWNLVVSHPGNYDVLATWAADPSNASNAKYTIQHAVGQNAVVVDQRTTAGINRLGTYFFNKGSYKVTLTDAANGRVIADTVSLNPLFNPAKLLQVEFRADVRSGPAPLSVQFLDLSSLYSSAGTSARITTWYWNFGDNTTSTVQNPVHTYTKPGVYTVSLRVSDDAGANETEVKSAFVVVAATSDTHAEFTAAKRVNPERAVVNFMDQSSGNISNWNWDFGDGSSSSDQNPTHLYGTPGLYTVTLTVSGPGGTDTHTELNFVSVLFGTVYADNLFRYKPHYYQRTMGTYKVPGKVILDTGGVTIQPQDLRYSRIFYGSCNSCQYFSGNLQRGIMFCTTEDYPEYTATTYLKYYLLGDSDQEILNRLNRNYPIHELINFNLKPPSIR